MLWLSLSSSLSLSPSCIDSALCLDMGFWEVLKGENENGLENYMRMRRINVICRRLVGLSRGSMALLVEYLGKDNEEERDNHSIASLNEYSSL